MPKCKYCNENITRFDKEICPFCGGRKPLEGNEEHTCDITQCIDIMKQESELEFKQKSHITNGLLCMFLGLFGADAFYLGFKKLGLYRILVNLIIFSAISLPLYFLTKLSFYSFAFAGAGLFVLYFILGIVNLFIKGKKDANGVFIR